MIKVYSGDKTFYLTNKMKDITDVVSRMKLPIKFTMGTQIKTKTHLVKHYNSFVNDEDVYVHFFYDENIARVSKLFKSMFKNIEAGGGLVKNAKGEYLFIFRNGKWDLPKGKLEKGETIKKCAKREVMEECGIKKLSVKKQLTTTYHIYKLKEKEVLKQTTWFEMECLDTSKLKPQTEEGITKVKWFKKENLKTVVKNTYPSVIDVIEKIQK